MDYKKVLSCPTNEPTVSLYSNVLFEPTAQVEHVLAHYNLLHQSQNESKCREIDDQLSNFLIDIEEQYRYLTQDLKERFFFDGIMDEFTTTDILEVLEECLTLEPVSLDETCVVSDVEAE